MRKVSTFEDFKLFIKDVIDKVVNFDPTSFMDKFQEKIDNIKEKFKIKK